ncbi:cupin domain-containing protein [Rhizobium lentis]|uniref:Helix-turn-helix transcriptional regulator n=1 Tax=Rhizobium lentis TaxID=1138194 RepID=A0ABS7IAF4_9HYPH|nr:AraC family transcriptional regulator [Rhizobium lentis]MBX5041184.1 helix-turn-helix transcriptional regulator [Rhizobium lentis]MBX5051883.1 helix-turn-helix transcriptional regulator [Rhizobium lentis]MBX5071441.1 helix-turn-helix transcriptional regulator [Rhizobium lentis]MBX5088451.1 helix-turn-helix transcriptional regulator [Rhizobium lentis]MBX5108521.1 helix-turn-helix transcriptional regulator [Rhizobium lentis]
MSVDHDPLDRIAPVLRVRPELQDFCRFGGSWSLSHPDAGSGWAAFHIVVKGECLMERSGSKPVRLQAGDVILLPHGDGHVVYSNRPSGELQKIIATPKEHIRLKQTEGVAIDTELVCGRLHLESTSENMLLRTLPYLIVLQLGGYKRYVELVAMIRDELEGGCPGAANVASDLASALFVMLLRQYLEKEPPTNGLLALLSSRGTGRAAAAMVADPAHAWTLDELASLAAVSRPTLVRAFRKLCGMPPLMFLVDLRLGLARNRILHSVESFADIAAAVGYQSEAALSKAIHRHFGIRPGAMRRTHLENQ